jgi:hypothetical protein
LLIEECANKSQSITTRYIEFGGAFGVLRLDTAFPALLFASDPLKAKGMSPKTKAGKTASSRSTPNAPRSQVTDSTQV